MMRSTVPIIGFLGAFIGFLIFVCIIIAIILIVVRMARMARQPSNYHDYHGDACQEGQTHGSRRADNSMEILRERFAKGEITTEEYEHMKATLTRE